MTVTNLLRPLMAGVLHSFEADHMSAVAVLASEQAIKNKRTTFMTLVKSSQWALGHSVTLLLFGGLALIFKSALGIMIEDISFWAEASVGPIMIWLGVVAIRRNHKLNAKMKTHKLIDEHEHDLDNPIHLHGKSGEEIAMNPMNRSFWVGMLHGVAGTGGALTSALIISAPTIQSAVLILVVESVGIIVAMGVYSYSLIAIMSRFIERNLVVFKWINGLTGALSIIIGFIFILNIWLS